MAPAKKVKRKGNWVERYKIRSMEENRLKSIIGIIFIIIGIIIIVIGVYFLIANLNFVNKSIAAKGTISENYIKFDANGKQVKVTSGYIDFIIKFAKNPEVNMVYNPENPENAKVDSFNSLWAIPGCIVIIGLIIIFIGVYSLIKDEK